MAIVVCSCCVWLFVVFSRVCIFSASAACRSAGRPYGVGCLRWELPIASLTGGVVVGDPVVGEFSFPTCCLCVVGLRALW